MKTFRTIILLAGILVAGLAMKEAVAQGTVNPENKESFNNQLKGEIKDHPKTKTKSPKHKLKEYQKRDLKHQLQAQKSILKKKYKTKDKERATL